MTEEHRQLDAIESALLELESGESADLFRATRVRPGRLLLVPVKSGGGSVRRFVPRAASVAAVIAVAIGVWSWMFSAELARIQDRADVPIGVVASSAGLSTAAFLACFEGPTEVLASNCRDQDYNTDGHVDLADYGAFQSAYRTRTP